MTDTHGYLGGDHGHRSFFGGRWSKTRLVLLGTVAGFGLVGTVVLGAGALIAALVAAAVVMLATASTHNGSILDRRRRRARWKARRRTGWDAFTPYDADRWAQLVELRTTAPKNERAAVARELATMRANPDGADGMGWLQCGRNEAGIAWHAPLGQEEYLSVAFEVAGQIVGLDDGEQQARAGDAWSTFLASRADAASLVGTVQTITRVLSPDTARLERWALDSLDPSVPLPIQHSYAEVIARSAGGAMVQRHYVVLTWPISARFRDLAARHAPGRDGWRALMAAQIDSTLRGLRQARMGAVRALTARQTTALIVHQQNPSHPVDDARVDPASFGVPSHDEFSAHIVGANDYDTGAPVQWWHRTCALTAEHVIPGPRTQLWVLDLLTARLLGDVVRTVSFHLRLVPAAQARAAAGRDLTRDMADEVTDRSKGRMVADTTTVAATAARRRYEDLSSGSQHHGIEWVGYVTLTAPSRAALADACHAFEDVVLPAISVDRADWQDSMQSSASGTTWPIARGLRGPGVSASSFVYDRLAGRTQEGAL